jgi:23S rRNA pseudouridine1911/1915/1917 synthase
MIVKTFYINKSQGPKPVDLALGELLPGLSRRHIRRILDQGGILLNGKPVRRAGDKTKAGDKLVVSYSEEGPQKTPTVLTPDSLIWEDPRGIFAFNKPPLLAAVPTVSKKTPHMGRSLAESFPKIFPKEPLACHRLDKETSGLMLFAKTAPLCEEMMELFKKRQIQKTYLALVWGAPKEKTWKISCYLSPIDKKTGSVKPVQAGGKPSETAFELLGSHKKMGVSLIRCLPHTGRSHQIRVHLGTLSGLPILGDKRYDPALRSRPLIEHHLLHAWKLSWPQGPDLTASLPALMAQWVRDLFPGVLE